MAEYIERGTVYTLVKKICDAIQGGEYHSAIFGQIILDWIDDLPAADVKPVVRGEWKPSAIITSGTGSVWRTHGVACSVCNGFYLEETNFCPNCGADMRGEDNGEIH